MAKTETAVNRPASTNKPVENGAVNAPSTAQTAPDAAETKKPATRGVVPTMPMGVVYRLPSGRVVAAIVSPNGDSFKAEGKGQGSAIGELVDSGFTLSALKEEGPVWIAERGFIPAGSEVIGYATIAGFPLPKQ